MSDGEFVQQTGIEEVGFIQGQIVVVLVVRVGDVRGARCIAAAPFVGIAIPLYVGREAEPVLGAEIVIDPRNVCVLTGKKRVVHVNAADVADGVGLVDGFSGAQSIGRQRLIGF